MKEKTKDIVDAIAKGQTTYGMQTFDQSIMELLNKGFIAYDEALAQSSNPDDFALRVKGITATSDEGWKEFEKPKETQGKKEEPKLDIERF